MTDTKKLVETFRVEFEDTKSLEAAVRAVAVAVAAGFQEDGDRRPTRGLDLVSARGTKARRPLTSAQIVTICSTVATANGVTVEQLRQGKVKKAIEARHVACFLMRGFDMSYPEIARVFRLRDHTYALHAVRRVLATSDLITQANRTIASLDFEDLVFVTPVHKRPAHSASHAPGEAKREAA